MMANELVYRFCVRQKPAPEGPETSRRIFITRTYLTEAAARERYEVIERLEHTAKDATRHEAIVGFS